MADFSQSTLEQLNDPAKGLLPSNVSRKTVADGSWLQKYTFGKLSARDDFLADQIDGLADQIDGVSGNLASAYDDMVEDITDLQDDVVSLSDEIKNMSPLTYRGNGSVNGIKTKTDKRNGDVYSISGLTGSSAKSGVWWIGGTTKSGDNDFKVKNNDEVAYTSADDRWFPIGQDIHVEYSAVYPVYIEDGQTIGIYSSATDKWNDVVNKLDSSAAALTYLTQTSADTLYYPLSNNPSGYLTEITGNFSGNNVSANNFFINGKTDNSYMKISAVNDTIKYEQCNQGGMVKTIDVKSGYMTFSSSNTTSKFETIIKPGEITISSDAMPGYCVIFDAKGVSSINQGITNFATWASIISKANS